MNTLLIPKMHYYKTPDGKLIVYKYPILNSALVSDLVSTDVVNNDCTIHFGWKPIAATELVLSDMTAHYLITIRKVGSTVTVWKQNIELATYSGTIGTTYADFIKNVLTYYAGSYSGYFSKLIVIDGNSNYTYEAFMEASEYVTGLWIPKEPELVEFSMLDDTNIFTGGTASGSACNSYGPVTGLFDGGIGYDPEQAVAYFNSAPFYAIYDFGSGNATRIDGISIQASDEYNNTMPTGFDVLGSNDAGATWDTLLSVTGEAAWAVSEKRTYMLTSPGTYQSIKLAITAAPYGYCIIGEFSGYGAIISDYGKYGVHLDFSNADDPGADASWESVVGDTISPDPTFAYDGTAGGWTITGTVPSTISGGVLSFVGSSLYASCAVTGDYVEGNKYLVKVVVDSHTTGQLGVFSYYNNNDGTNSENRAEIPIGPGTYYAIIETDDDSYIIGLQYRTGVSCDAVISELWIYPLEDASYTGPNDWTITGTQNNDTPTNNHMTFDPLSPNVVGTTLSSGNLSAAANGYATAYFGALPTFGIESGKIYGEFKIDIAGHAGYYFGLSTVYFSGGATYPGSPTYQGISLVPNGNTATVGLYANGEQINLDLPSITTVDDVFGLAVDLDLGKVWVSFNDSWLTGNPVLGTDPALSFTPFSEPVGWHCVFGANITERKVTLYNGATGFIGTCPSKFNSICINSLIDPTVLHSASMVDILLREGSTSVFVGGTAYAGSYYDSRYYPAYAFDGDETTCWLNNRSNTDWLAYKCATGVTLYTYKMMVDANCGIGNAPKTWTVQGSNDSTNGTDGTWTVVDTVADSGTYTVDVYKTFTVDNPGEYLWYKWVITSAIDGATAYGIGVTEIVGYVNPAITSLEFTPGMVIHKCRDVAKDWVVRVANRTSGAAKLSFSLQTEEVVSTSLYGTFLENGYNVGDSSWVNADGASYLDISIKSDALAGFETYSFNPNETHLITHSLGKPITFAMLKPNDANYGWDIFHTALGLGKYLQFTTATVYTDASVFTANTSTTFDIGTFLIGSGVTDAVLYLFTDSDIVKAFSYIGNELTDGPLVDLGGRPLIIPFLKNCNVATNWLEHNVKSGFTYYMGAHSNRIEDAAAGYVIPKSVGFKINTDANSWNGSGNLFIGLAILESVKKYTNAF